LQRRYGAAHAAQRVGVPGLGAAIQRGKAVQAVEIVGGRGGTNFGLEHLTERRGQILGVERGHAAAGLLLQHQNPDPPNLLESNITIREDKMKKTAFTEEQIAYALRQAETGTPVADICRKLGISEQTFYRWKKKFAWYGHRRAAALAPAGRRKPYA
jgi:hypothetical protein